MFNVIHLLCGLVERGTTYYNSITLKSELQYRLKFLQSHIGLVIALVGLVIIGDKRRSSRCLSQLPTLFTVAKLILKCVLFMKRL